MTRINKNNKQIKEKINLLTEKLSKYGFKEREDHNGKKHSHIEYIYINQYQKYFTIWINTVKKPRNDKRIYKTNFIAIRQMFNFGVPYFETAFNYDLKENN